MKLIPEQIKYLRAKKRELERLEEEHRKYCQTRESGGMESFGLPHYLDFQEQMSNDFSRQEARETDYALENAHFMKERNFDMIDIGTAFYVDFGDGEIERSMLIEGGTPSMGTEMVASTDSDFGKAVLGHKDGDKVDYTVTATGRKMSITIKEIDRIKENYTHFIRERNRCDRISESAKKSENLAKRLSPDLYKRKKAITPSQVVLLKQELSKLGYRPKNQSDITRKANIERMLNEENFTTPKKGNYIHPGSYVTIMVLGEDGKTQEYSFEFINEAVSTEIEGEYVESISPLGTALEGLRPGDGFSAKRNHLPDLKGMVLTVDNTRDLERVK